MALAWVTALITQRCEKIYVDNNANILIECKIRYNVNITRQKTCNHHKITAIEMDSVIVSSARFTASDEDKCDRCGGKNGKVFGGAV